MNEGQDKKNEARLTYTIRLRPSTIAFLKALKWSQRKSIGEIVEQAIYEFFRKKD